MSNGSAALQRSDRLAARPGAATEGNPSVLRLAAMLAGVDVSRPLVWLRWVAVAASLLTVLGVHYGLAIPLPIGALGVVIAVYAVWSLAVHLWQLHAGRPGPTALTFLLKGDVLALTLLLYFSGGWTNPVVSLYLVPVAVSAAVLPVRNALAVTLTCAAAYSWLTVWHVPLPSVDQRFGGDFNLHIAGMWVNFLVASLLTAVFVATLASRVRSTDRALMRARERQLRDEHIVSLGTLAAGAAHELSTPLNTLRLLLDEIEAEDRGLDDRERLELVRRQLDLMQDRLRVLRTRSDEVRSEAATPMPVRAFVEQVVDRWRAARPDVLVEMRWPEDFENVRIVGEETVAQALASVLNNAADASQAAGVNRIGVSPECVCGELRVAVRDWGDGVPKHLDAGQAPRFGTTKAHGNGVGLVLSHASLERLGGRLRFSRQRAESGSVVVLELPLAALDGSARLT